MEAIDGWLEGLLSGQASLGLILLVSLALGLRHASDPDHLAAVTTLIASGEARSQIRKAGFLGFSWGLGHGTALVLIGLPLVFFNSFLPEVIGQIAEFVIGLIIVALAVHLLLRWRRGLFHAHGHGHDDQEASHRHLHSHASEADESHEHAHFTGRRTPLSAYGIGIAHGIGGSAGLTLLLISTIPSTVEATGALLIFAGGTVISMALLTTVFGFAIARGPIARNFERVAPVLGSLALIFGAWYALGALELVAFPL